MGRIINPLAFYKKKDEIENQNEEVGSSHIKKRLKNRILGIDGQNIRPNNKNSRSSLLAEEKKIKKYFGYKIVKIQFENKKFTKKQTKKNKISKKYRRYIRIKIKSRK